MNKIKPHISDKDTIRTEVKRRISLLNEEEKNEGALSLYEKLRNFPIIKESQNIIIHNTLDDEIGFALFIERTREEGKNIFTIDSSGNHPSLPAKGVILVPGRAFTISGNRIGRGGGWYDSFLKKHPHLYTIGICFDCQIFPELPQDKWDIPMDEVIYSGPHSGQ